MGERQCEYCGALIHARRRSDIRFCSTRCRVRAHRDPIPAELRDQPRWVNHKEKVPVDPKTGAKASTTNPATWASYHLARQNSRNLGYVLGDGVACIDLDHCIKADGSLTNAAQAIVDFYPENWIEVSPSGHGLHIWGYADEQPGFKRTWNGQQIEFYSQGRYITITGKTYQAGTLKTL